MIHVCRVDIGSRHVFDSADGIDDVGSLISAIEAHFKIEKTKQILLIGGGEVLEDGQQKLYRLSAGREEQSPIYLIDKLIVEKETPPAIETPLGNLTQDMKLEIQAAILYKPSFQTLQSRSNLAHRVHEYDKNLHRLCKSFYDDQFWQYQGYLALIANLDDYVSSFRKKEEIIREHFEKFLGDQLINKELLNNIDKHVEFLAHVRLLPEILNSNSMRKSFMNKSNLQTSPNQTQHHIFSSFSSQSISNLQSFSNNINNSSTIPPKNKRDDSPSNLKVNSTLNTNITLLDWIKSTDPQNKLNNVVEETKEMLEKFSTNLKWNDLQMNIAKLLNQIDSNSEMREIHGLTKRLQDLNAFLEESDKLLASQAEIQDSFSQNLERATKLKDQSILQDLCRGHEKQLELFKSNHFKMIEITNKISKAKLELIRVIHFRLHWVMQIQKQICDFDFQLQVNFKQLKRLNVRIKLMEQIKKAPYFYLCSMRETLRRKKFTTSYKSFASSIQLLISAIYKAEMKRRHSFESKTNISSSTTSSQNFVLSILFRSLNDKVQNFLNENDLNFDTDLPEIVETDVFAIEEEIKNYILLNNNNQINNTSVTFNSGSTSSTTSSSSSSTSTNQIPQFEPSSFNAQAIVSPKTIKNKENTVEFYENFLRELEINENNDQDKKDDIHLTILDTLTNFLNKNNYENDESTDVNEINLKILGEPLKSGEIKSSTTNLITKVTKEIRSKLVETKVLLSVYQKDANSQFSDLIKVQKEIENKMNINDEALKKKKEQTKKNEFYKRVLDSIENLLKNNSIDESSSTTQSTNEESSEDEFLIKLTKMLKSYHLENLKEKEELKLNMKNLKNNINADKQKLFNEAINRVTKDKEKLLDELRRKELGYIEEIKTLKESIDKLKATQPVINAHADESSTLTTAPIKIDEEPSTVKTNLDDENVNETKAKLKEIMYKEKIEQLEKRLSLLSTLPITNDYETIQLNSCNIDDLVIAIFSEEHNSYKIIHKSSAYLHFVHSAIFKSHEHKLTIKSSESSNNVPILLSPDLADEQSTAQFEMQFDNSNKSNDPLNQSQQSSSLNNISSSLNNKNSKNGNILTSDLNFLHSTSPLVKNSPSDNIDNIFLKNEQPQWFIGRVIVKEFCIARRENNRFRVPSGTRFYRVKLKPYNLNPS